MLQSARSASRTQRKARIACANATPGEHERGAEAERVGEQQHDAARDVAARAGEHEDRREHRADARRGADRERAAEQRARAAAPRALQQPGRDRALRPAAAGRRTRARSRSARSRRSGSASTSATTLAIAAAPAPSATKTSREADDERDARDHDPPRRAALAEPVDLDGGDGREVARHERQHARRDHRDEPGEERDRELLKHRSGRAPRRRGARARDRAAARRRRGTAAVGGAVARPVPGAPPPSATAPTAIADERQQPGEQVEAVRCAGRRGSPAQLFGGQRAVDDLALRLARGDAACGCSAFICRATGESDSSSVVWHVGQTSSRLELALGRMLLARERRRGEREASTSAAAASSRLRPAARRRLQRASGCPRRASASRGRADDVRRHDAAVPVDEERLGVAGDAVVADERPAVADDRVVDPEPLHERRAPARAGPARRRRRRRRPCRPSSSRGRASVARLLRARRAVRLPEVEDDDLAAQRGEARAPGRRRRAAA